MQRLYDQLIASLLPGKILSVLVGLSRTAVLVETDEGIRCGLAASLSNSNFHYTGRSAIRRAGHLHEMSARDLAALIHSESWTEASVGLAAINALLPRHPSGWRTLKAEDDLAARGAGKNIAVIGHFPFVERLRPLARSLWVFELDPKEGDLPASEAPRILPQADFIAITSTTLINKTFAGLMELCPPQAEVILLGPSTPLSPILYEYGVSTLSGAVVEDTQNILTGIGQAMSVQQLRQEGLIRFVTMQKDASPARP